MWRRGLVVSVLVVPALIAGGQTPGSGGAPSAAPPAVAGVPKLVAAGTGAAGELSAVQRRAIEGGPLVPDQAAYAEQKKAADARAAAGPGGTAPVSGGSAPVTVRSWLGIVDTNSGPSDSTGAIGTTRYIEMVNTRFGIYTRTANTPLSTGTLNALVGSAAGANVFDPQVIWDPATSRFYYVTDTVLSDTDNRLSFGFSKTASPNSAADFCKYELQFGGRFPDYPKLGDLGGAGTTGLALIGTNTFNGTTGAYIGSDLYSITKPPAGTTCPAGSTFVVGARTGLRDANGTTPVFTPVPANQTDTGPAGYAVANAAARPATRIPTFRITKSATNTLVVAPVRNVAVPSYNVPANAPQPGTTRRLDTLDTRHTQAVSAIDPARGGVTAIWTQHTVAGGAGAVVRWYEINPNPSVPVLFQSGTISGASTGVATRFVYNGAISSDRQRNGATVRFGGSMVVGFNTSSATQRVDVRMGSKIGGAAISFRGTPIRTSAASLNDFTCGSGVCRWGDYSAATPDPGTASTATRGRVWLTNGFVRAAGSASAAGWGTWNWAAAP